jgi:hypothetical protein
MSSNFFFNGEPQSPADLKTAVSVFNFDPPENIAGKTCYVEARLFIWDQLNGPPAALNSRDGFVLDIDWTQLNSGFVQQTTPTPTLHIDKVRAPYAAWNTNLTRNMGPILVYIPKGPHRVTFTVYRPDDGQISSSQTGNVFTANLIISPVSKT